MKTPESASQDYDIVADANEVVTDKIGEEFAWLKEEIESASEEGDYHKTVELCLEFNKTLDWWARDDCVYDKYRYRVKVEETGRFMVWQEYNSPEVAEVDLDVRRLRGER